MGTSFFCMCFCVPCCGTGMVQGVLLSCHASFRSDGCALHPACSYVQLFACTLLLVPISFHRDGAIALPSLNFPWSGGGGPPTLLDPPSPSTRKNETNETRHPFHHESTRGRTRRDRGRNSTPPGLVAIPFLPRSMVHDNPPPPAHGMDV